MKVFLRMWSRLIDPQNMIASHVAVTAIVINNTHKHFLFKVGGGSPKRST